MVHETCISSKNNYATMEMRKKLSYRGTVSVSFVAFMN